MRQFFVAELAQSSVHAQPRNENMNVNDGVASTLEDHLTALGGIPASRVRLTPPPGRATVADLLAANETEPRCMCELVDSTLVEKAVGYEASVVAATILFLLKRYVSERDAGLISGSDGFFQLLSSVRGPDVAFVSRNRLPGGTFPQQAIPQVVPNLAVEVLSPANTKGEMARKRLEYFHAGVEAVWIVDCLHRTIAAYRSPSEHQVFGEEDVIDGGHVLPGFTCPVRLIFADLDIGQPQA